MKFLHELDEARELFEIVTDELGIEEPYLFPIFSFIL